MHVCHFCETSVEGHYFKNISKGLVEKDVKVSCLILGSASQPKWLDEISEVRYFQLNCSNRWQYPLAVWRLAKLLRREKIDILQTHLFYAGLIGVLAKRLNPQTIVAFTRHHTSIVKDLGSKIHVALDRWMAERADYAVAVSEATKKYMVETDKIRKVPIEVVYLGFDFSNTEKSKIEKANLRREFGLPDESFVIGYVANFAARKGHFQLVSAFSEIVKQIPNARLLLIGSGKLKEVDDAIEKLGLNESVKFTGWRSNVPDCLSIMDVFVQPSLSEAFSQVLVEAMGAGLPVIATKVGGASEVIQDGQYGFLIEPNDIPKITESVLKLYQNQTLRESIALKGKEFVRREFTLEKLVNSQFELYKRWLKTPE